MNAVCVETEKSQDVETVDLLVFSYCAEIQSRRLLSHGGRTALRSFQ